MNLPWPNNGIYGEYTSNCGVYTTNIHTGSTCTTLNLKEMVTGHGCPDCPSIEPGEKFSFVMSGGSFHIKGCPKIKK